MIKNLASRFSLAFLTLAAGSMLCGQVVWASVNDLPVRTVRGKECHVYKVRQKETVYSISRALGITRQELYEANPSARDGLRAGQELYFPVAGSQSGSGATQSAQAEAPARPTHKVSRGETVYGIGKKYGITPDQIYEWNPRVRDGLKAGEVIIVGPAQAQQPQSPAETPSLSRSESAAPQKAAAGESFTFYTVRDKETFYSIARAHGLTPRQLEEANPQVGVLHAGDTIRIPLTGTTAEPSGESSEAVSRPLPPEEVAVPAPAPSEVAVTEVAEEPAVVPSRLSSIDIALTLPLMLESGAERSRQADLYTEFYKGFLVAVDSLRHIGMPINVSLYDTKANADTLNAILSRPEFGKARVVVGPDSEALLERLGRYGALNGVWVFNPFVVRDESYNLNPYMMQANIPQAMMYDKAIDGIITRYADCLPVILVHGQDAQPDKKAFVDRMTARFDSVGIAYRTITYETTLNGDLLSDLPSDRNLLFIPAGGRQAEANRILPALVALKERGANMRLLGYPEWITFHGETLDNMHKVNTTVYSRFYISDDDAAAKNLDGRFVYWYGKPMANVFPRQGLLGFDTGMYLIQAMRDTGGDLSALQRAYDGIQNGFHFVRGSRQDSGLVNDVLYFINYTPQGDVEKVQL